MIKRTILAIAAAGAVLVAGCDDRSKTTSVPSGPAKVADVSPTTQPVELAAATTETHIAPPATQPVVPPHSTFSVADGISPPAHFDFPRAKLHIDRDEKVAFLYSDDPKSAINRDYAGNSYYFKIPLTDEALDHLDGYQWHFKAASSDQQDDGDGLFLEGQRYHIQPLEGVVAFRVEGLKLKIGLDGNFMKFDMSHSPHEGQMVRVHAEPTVDMAK